MDDFFGKMFRRFVGFLLLPAAAAVVYAAAGSIAAAAPELVRSPFTWGFALMALPALLVALREPLSQTLEHEFGHYAAGVLFGNEVVRVAGHRHDVSGDPTDGGETVPASPWTGYGLVALAPYFLPLLTLLLLPVRCLVTPSVQPMVDFLIGATLVWHFTTMIVELWAGQSDIAEATVLFSIPVILIINGAGTVLAIAVVLEDLGEVRAFAREAWAASGTAYRIALGWLKQLVDALRGFLT